MLFCLANWDHYIIRSGRKYGSTNGINRISFSHFLLFCLYIIRLGRITKEKEGFRLLESDGGINNARLMRAFSLF